MSREEFVRIEAAFHELLALDAGERDRALLAHERDDPSFAAALRSLLASHESPLPIDRIAGEAADALARDGQPTGRILEAALDAAIGAPRERTLPERIGAYRPLRVIGEGGMGTVYEAEQDAPRRRVALKVLRHDLAGLDPSSPLWRRFLNEAQALGRLRHPGIAHVHEAGTYDAPTGPRPFLVMEFIDGPTLPQALATRATPLRERLAIMLAVVDAVAYAHGQGVIHRDLKPGNVMIDADGRPRILDFGLARLNDARGEGLSFRTEHGQIMGTLAYMSPEQLGGRNEEVTERSDIYALGVMLYELLAGRLPHELRGMPLPEAARVVRDEEPSRLGSFDRSLRGDLETIAAKAMAKEARMRYPSAAAMADDLRRHLADEPIVARPPSALYQWGKFARRHRGLVVAVAAAFAILVVSTIALAWLATLERSQRSLAEARAEEATAGRYRAALLSAQSALAIGNVALAERSLEESPSAQRGWEFEHLRWLASQAVATLDVGGVPVALGCDATGAIAIVMVRPEGAPHAVVRQIDLRATELALAPQSLGIVEPPEMPSLFVSPDGRWAALTGAPAADGGAATWLIDVPAMRLAWTSARPVPSAVQPFVADPASGEIALAVQADDERAIELLACTDGRSLHRLEVGSSHAYSLGVPGLPVLLCWLDVHAHTVAIDLRDGSRLWRMDARPVAFDRDPRTGSELVSLRDPREGLVVDPMSGAVLAREPLAVSIDELARHSCDRRMTLSLDRQGRATLRSTADGSVLRAFNATVTEFVPRREMLLAGQADGLLRLMPIADRNGAPIGPVIAPAVLWAPTAAAVSPDGTLVATMHWGLLHCFDALTGAVRWSKCLSRRGTAAIAFDRSSSRLAMLDARGAVRIVDARDGGTILERDDAPAARILFDAEGRLLAVRPGPRPVLEEIALDAGGATVAPTAVSDALTTGGGHVVRILDDGVAFEGGPTIPVDGAVVAADLDLAGELAAILFADGRLELWPAGAQTATTRPVATARITGMDRSLGPTADAPRLAFSPDGTRLVASDLRGDIHLLETARLGELIVLQVPSLRVLDLRFSPDGRRLLATGGEHAVVAFETALDLRTAVERRDESRAAAALRERLQRGLIVEEARRSIADELVDPDARALAIDRSYRYADDANRLNSLAWGIVRVPERDPSALERAMVFARAAEAVFPEDHAILNTRAAVEYRLGRFEEALRTLDRCDRLAMASRGELDVVDLLFRAMCLAGLGREHEARAVLRALEPRVEALIAGPDGGDPVELAALVREARAAAGIAP